MAAEDIRCSIMRRDEVYYAQITFTRKVGISVSNDGIQFISGPVFTFARTKEEFHLVEIQAKLLAVYLESCSRADYKNDKYMSRERWIAFKSEYQIVETKHQTDEPDTHSSVAKVSSKKSSEPWFDAHHFILNGIRYLSFKRFLMSLISCVVTQSPNESTFDQLRVIFGNDSAGGVLSRQLEEQQASVTATKIRQIVNHYSVLNVSQIRRESSPADPSLTSDSLIVSGRVIQKNECDLRISDTPGEFSNSSELEEILIDYLKRSKPHEERETFNRWVNNLPSQPQEQNPSLPTADITSIDYKLTSEFESKLPTTTQPLDPPEPQELTEVYDEAVPSGGIKISLTGPVVNESDSDTGSDTPDPSIVINDIKYAKVKIQEQLLKLVNDKLNYSSRRHHVVEQKLRNRIRALRDELLENRQKTASLQAYAQDMRHTHSVGIDDGGIESQMIKHTHIQIERELLHQIQEEDKARLARRQETEVNIRKDLVDREKDKFMQAFKKDIEESDVRAFKMAKLLTNQTQWIESHKRVVTSLQDKLKVSESELVSYQELVEKIEELADWTSEDMSKIEQLNKEKERVTFKQALLMQKIQQKVEERDFNTHAAIDKLRRTVADSKAYVKMEARPSLRDHVESDAESAGSPPIQVKKVKRKKQKIRQVEAVEPAATTPPSPPPPPPRPVIPEEQEEQPPPQVVPCIDESVVNDLRNQLVVLSTTHTQLQQEYAECQDRQTLHIQQMNEEALSIQSDLREKLSENNTKIEAFEKEVQSTQSQSASEINNLRDNIDKLEHEIVGVKYGHMREIELLQTRLSDALRIANLVPTGSQAVFIYVTEDGDTIPSLCERFSVTQQQLFDANDQEVLNSLPHYGDDQIAIVVPMTNDTLSQLTTMSQLSITRQQEFFEHLIAEGESLQQLADLYSIQNSDLIAANFLKPDTNVTDPEALQGIPSGMIRIPTACSGMRKSLIAAQIESGRKRTEEDKERRKKEEFEKARAQHRTSIQKRVEDMLDAATTGKKFAMLMRKELLSRKATRTVTPETDNENNKQADPQESPPSSSTEDSFEKPVVDPFLIPQQESVLSKQHRDILIAEQDRLRTDAKNIKSDLNNLKSEVVSRKVDYDTHHNQIIEVIQNKLTTAVATSVDSAVHEHRENVTQLQSEVQVLENQLVLATSIPQHHDTVLEASPFYMNSQPPGGTLRSPERKPRTPELLGGFGVVEDIGSPSACFAQTSFTDTLEHRRQGHFVRTTSPVKKRSHHRNNNHQKGIEVTSCGTLTELSPEKQPWVDNSSFPARSKKFMPLLLPLSDETRKSSPPGKSLVVGTESVMKYIPVKLSTVLMKSTSRNCGSSRKIKIISQRENHSRIQLLYDYDSITTRLFKSFVTETASVSKRMTASRSGVAKLQQAAVMRDTMRHILRKVSVSDYRSKIKRTCDISNSRQQQFFALRRVKEAVHQGKIASAKSVSTKIDILTIHQIRRDREASENKHIIHKGVPICPSVQQSEAPPSGVVATLPVEKVIKNVDHRRDFVLPYGNGLTDFTKDQKSTLSDLYTIQTAVLQKDNYRGRSMTPSEHLISEIEKTYRNQLTSTPAPALLNKLERVRQRAARLQSDRLIEILSSAPLHGAKSWSPQPRMPTDAVIQVDDSVSVVAPPFIPPVNGFQLPKIDSFGGVQKS